MGDTMNGKKVFPDRETFERIYEESLENQPQLDVFQRALFDDVKDEAERKLMEYLALLEKEKFKYGYECGYRAGLNEAERHSTDRGKTYEDGLAEAQKDKVIHVGDVVSIKRARSLRGVVTGIENGWHTILFSNGDCNFYTSNFLYKTGRTIDIDKLLVQIGGAE